MTALIRTRRLLAAAALALAVGTAVAIGIAGQAGAFASVNTPAVAGLPLAAEPRTPVYLSELYTFTGWATVWYEEPNYWSETNARLIAPQPANVSVPAYKWSYGRWNTTSRKVGDRIWVAPFATDWSWVWSSDRGWLALRDKYIVVRWEYGGGVVT